MKPSVWKSIGKSAVCTLLFFSAQVLASLLGEVIFSVRFVRAGVAAEEIAPLLREAIQQNVYLILILSSLFFVGALYLYLRRDFPRSVSLQKTSPSALIAGVALGFGAYYAVSFFIKAFSVLPVFIESQNTYMEEQAALAAAQTSILPELLSITFICPFAEELLCRGAILNFFKKTLNAPLSIFLSALIFALIHGNLYQIVFTLPLGILLGYVAHRFGSVWPAFTLHAAFNFSNYLVQLPNYLGIPAKSASARAIMAALGVFFVMHIPLGIFLLLRASRKNTETLSQKEGIAMPAPSLLIVGLGNPGDRYANTRHNSGFLALDALAARASVRADRLRFHALTGEIELGGQKAILMKPQTFMNLSGDAVREAADFYHIPPEKILVYCDDVNFEPGVFRIRASGSSGGHNGLKDIAQKIGSENFARVKIGIGRLPEGWDLADFVLSKIPPADEERIRAALPDLCHTADLFAAGQLDRAASLYNGKPHGFAPGS